MNHTINERTLRLAASLGIDAARAARDHTARTTTLAHTAAHLDASLAPGRVALITGPSGTGKSTLLGLFPRTPRTVVAKPLTRRLCRTRVAALCARTPLAQWATLLARFGLAEASVLISRAGDLSAGEQARLELALAAAKCELLGTSPGRKPGDGGPDALALAIDPERERASTIARPCASAQGSLSVPTTLIIDEWCSALDRTTAASVAAGAARWARDRNIRLIGATAHNDLAAAINADTHITLNGHGNEGGIEWTGFGLSKAG